MPVKLLVTSVEKEQELIIPQKEFLGWSEKAKEQLKDQAIELQELVNSIVRAVGDSIQVESKLSIELSGSVKIGGGLEAGVPDVLVFLNLFKAKGEGEAVGGMKLTLETTVGTSQPKD
jgi:hypothetical protein